MQLTGVSGQQAPNIGLELISGRAGWCVMGIERLNSAAHAAGFAMAGTEEAYEDLGAEPDGHLMAETRWQPSRAVLVPGSPTDATDWLSLLLGLFGRRAPARRPALTAEA
jgi:hypothetical protein